MKALLRVCGVLSVLLIAVLMLGRAQIVPPGTEVSSAKGPIIILDPPNSKDWTLAGTDYLKTVTTATQELIDRIPSGRLLTPDAVPLIAAVYGANGNFTGHDGLTYKGICEISLYFYKLILHHKITDFRIQIRVIYAKEFSERAKKTVGPKDEVLHSFYFILASSFKLDGVPVDPPGSTNCPHVRMCDCSRSN